MVAFSADRRIRTCTGLVDVAVQVQPGGRCLARLAGHDPDLAAVGGAIGATEDEAVSRLAATINTLLQPSRQPRTPRSAG